MLRATRVWRRRLAARGRVNACGCERVVPAARRYMEVYIWMGFRSVADRVCGLGAAQLPTEDTEVRGPTERRSTRTQRSAWTRTGAVSGVMHVGGAVDCVYAIAYSIYLYYSIHTLYHRPTKHNPHPHTAVQSTKTSAPASTHLE